MYIYLINGFVEPKKYKGLINITWASDISGLKFFFGLFIFYNLELDFWFFIILIFDEKKIRQF